MNRPNLAKNTEYILYDYVNKRYTRDKEIVLMKEDYGVCLDKNKKYIHVFKMYTDSEGFWIKGVNFNPIQINANFKKSFWDNKANTQLKKVKDYIDSKFRAER